ncbi:hypothetical protein LOTGIDRAFT_172594 [Lottia gigantea]|uniref:BHLH domain-containing protein n=1 Tax=Lottia gigantea TaxID=225164 RepID=V4CHG2_LOTGI|nr:hypothetical protein LOTGIDRAFT_172594 [Lottia gigantea]ESP01560.1 hypothetical protein LOTGIDRAFT_172594 [Lottia gigantea]
MYSTVAYQQEEINTSSEWSDVSSFLTDLDSSAMCPEIQPINMYSESSNYDGYFPEQVMGMDVHSVSPSFSEVSTDKSDSGCYSDDSNSLPGNWAPPANFEHCLPPNNTFCPSFITNAHLPISQFQQPAPSTSQPTKKRRRRKQTPVQRGAANLRERKRMFYLNDAFDALKKSLPKKDSKSRLSRIDTLKTAIDYIQGLSELLQVV